VVLLFSFYLNALLLSFSRNEVWRYKSWDGFGKSALITLGRGLKYAVVAMAVTIAIDKAFGLHNSQHSHNSDH